MQVADRHPGDVNAVRRLRPLYLYFRDADITSTTAYQPGGTLNWVRTLFYNPCSGAGTPGCVTVGGTIYGPGGQPFIATAAAQADISAPASSRRTLDRRRSVS